MASAVPTRSFDGHAVSSRPVDRHMKRPRFPCIDGVRAIAAGTIFVYHAAGMTGTSNRKTIGPYLGQLHIGVPIFIVISGFLLYLPFVDSHINGQPAPAGGSFLCRRALRILPAYWLALTVAVLASFAAPIRSLWEGIIYYGLLQSYSSRYVFGGLPQGWTLCLEAAFYLCLPLYAICLRRLSQRTDRRFVLRFEIAGLVLLYGAGVAFRAWEWTAVPFGVQSLTWLPAQLDYFALGMALALVHRQVANRAVPGIMSRALGAAPLAWWGLALGCWVLSVQLVIGMGKTGTDPLTLLEQEFLTGATAFFLLVPAAFSTNDRGVVSGVLANRPIAFFGKISYGVYLWHITVLLTWFRVTGMPPLTGGLPGVLAVCVLGTSLVATFSWVAIERPAQRLGRRRRQVVRTSSS